MTETDTKESAMSRVSPGRLGIAAKLRAGVGALLAVTVAICVGLLIFFIELRANVDELSNDSLPSIVLFADLERSLENILYSTVELSEARDLRTQRNLFGEIEAQLNAIGAVLDDPVLASQSVELKALDNAINTSLSNLNAKVIERIGIEDTLLRHEAGMRGLRRMAAEDRLPPEVNTLLADLEEASALVDRYRLRVLSQEIGEAYSSLVAVGVQPGQAATRRGFNRPALRRDGTQPPRRRAPGIRQRPPLQTGLGNQGPGTPRTESPREALIPLLAPGGGLLAQRDELLKTNAAIRGLQSEVEAIVSDFAFVAQARFSRFRQVAADNAVRVQESSERITQLLAASLLISLVVAYLVSRSLSVNVSSRLAVLRENILNEARKVSRRQEERGILFDDANVDEIAAISGSVDVFLSVIGEANERLRRSLDTMEQDVDLARLMQESIVPRTFPDNPAYSVGASMQAARQVGGDFYEFFRLDDYTVSFAMADVSGKGVPAALFMAMTLTVLETAAESSRSPAAVLQEVNSRLCQQNPLYYFVTMFYGVLDLNSGQLTYCNAGHNPPVLVKSGSAQEIPLTDNTMLAVFEDHVFEEKHLNLEQGDTVFLFTDGVTEAFNTQAEEFGEQRLLSCLSDSSDLRPEELVETVTDSVKRFAGDEEQSDDMTVLAVRYNGIADVVSMADNYLVMEIPNDIAFVETVQKRLGEFYTAQDIPEDTQFETNLCIEEYIVNLVQYGYADQDSHVIQISVTRTDQGLEVVLTDDSTQPFDPLTAPTADTASGLDDRAVGGLGIHIIRNYMDHLSYSVTDQGNKFYMVKAIPKAA